MREAKTKKPKQVIEKITIHYKYGATKIIQKGAIAFFTETTRKEKKYQRVKLQFLNVGILDAYQLINSIEMLEAKLGIRQRKRRS